MSNHKPTKGERREEERAKEKKKKQKGATLAAQAHRSSVNKQYSNKKK